MKLGTLRSVMVTRTDLNEVGQYEYEIEVPEAELPLFDRYGFLKTWIIDSIRQASVDTGLPLNEKIWTFTVDPTAVILYGLKEWYRS